MEILSFKIKGKLAHFRKYYANNTAFSFTIPPRTTLMGIVAAAMGWSRDSYYDKLASRHIRFGIRVLSPLKKSFHRLNLLSIKSLGDMSKKFSSDFRGEEGRIQTPFEIVSGLDISKDEVIYQVFVSHHQPGRVTFEALKDHFTDSQPAFNITLGTASFTASIYDVEIFKGIQVIEASESDYVLMHSAVPSHLVVDLKFDKEKVDHYNFIEEDMLPGEFISNNNRELKSMNRVLFSTTPNPIRVRLKGSYLRITEEAMMNIQFMDA